MVIVLRRGLRDVVKASVPEPQPRPTLQQGLPRNLTPQFLIGSNSDTLLAVFLASLLASHFRSILAVFRAIFVILSRRCLQFILDCCSEILFWLLRENPHRKEVANLHKRQASTRNSIQPRPQIGLFRMKGIGQQFSHLPLCKWKFAPYLFQRQSSHVTEFRFFSQRSNCVSVRNLFKDRTIHLSIP